MSESRRARKTNSSQSANISDAFGLAREKRRCMINGGRGITKVGGDITQELDDPFGSKLQTETVKFFLTPPSVSRENGYSIYETRKESQSLAVPVAKLAE